MLDGHPLSLVLTGYRTAVADLASNRSEKKTLLI